MSGFDGALLQRADALLRWLGLDGRRIGNRWRGGPPGGRVEVVLAGSNAGAWGAWSAGRTGRGLTGLISFVRGIGYGEAIGEARRFLGEPDPGNAPPPHPPLPDPDSPDVLRARRIAARLHGIHRTAAERYLIEARGIPRPDAGWPEAVAFDPLENALVAIVQDDAGDIVAVHRVFLTAGGEKLSAAEVERRQLRAVKRSDGPKSAGTLYLRNTGVGPLCVVEGLETGLAVHASVELDVLVLLGPFAHARRLPTGRKIIACIEEDAPGSPAAETTHKRIVGLVHDGHSVALAWPRIGRPKADLADVIRELGPAAVCERIQQAEAVEPPPRPPHTAATSSLAAYYPAPTEDRATAKARQDGLIRDAIGDTERLAAARAEAWRRRNDEITAAGTALTPAQKAAITRRHNRAVAEERGYGRRLPLPGRLLITGSQGTGKTQEAYQAVAAIRTPMIVWITAPTVGKAEEIAGDYRRVAAPESPPAMVVRGRGQSDPQRPGHLMCDRNETAERVAQAGLSVPDLLCAKCPLKAECGSLRQGQEIEEIKKTPRGAVFLGATAQLFVHSPAPLPDLLIADDLVALSAVEVRKIPYAALDPFGIPHVPDFVRERVDTLRSALLLPSPLKLLRREGFTREVLQVMSKALDSAVDKATPSISGDMSDDAIAVILDSATIRTALRSALAVVGAVRREIDVPRDAFNAIYGRVEAGQPTITVCRLHRPNGIKRAGALVLDGTGDEDLDRKLFGERMRHERVAMERTAHITGTVGRNYSRVSITGIDSAGEAIANRAAGAARLRRDIETIREQLPGHAAVFSTMGAIDALLDSGAVPDDVPVGHFAKLRGLNTWEHCRSALVVGATSVSVGELEDTARAFMADDPVPFVSVDHPAPPDWRKGQWPYVATRMRRMRDGTLSPVTVEVHPDLRCQRVLEQIREADVVQAGDRARPYFNQRDLVFLNSLALDVCYDEIRPHRELVQGGNRLELTYKQFGLLPKGGRDLHRLDRDRYRTPKAAEHALSKLPAIVKRSLFFGFGEFSYRVDNQPGLPSGALVDVTRHPDPQVILQRHFGNITEFQGVKIAPHAPDSGLRPDQHGGWRGTSETLTAATRYSRPWPHGPPHE